MADGHGGARVPAHPAPVSPPGALSARTDGGPTQAPMVASGGPYGSRQAMENLEQSAPLAGGGGAEVTPPQRLDPSMLTGLTAPTQRPDEPVTAGADSGPGINAQAAGIRSPLENSIKQILPQIASLEMISNLPEATDATRQVVQAIKQAAMQQLSQQQKQGGPGGLSR